MYNITVYTYIKKHTIPHWVPGPFGSGSRPRHGAAQKSLSTKRVHSFRVQALGFRVLGFTNLGLRVEIRDLGF